MAIDTSIYQLAGRGVKSVADYDAEYSQARQNKIQEALGTAKLQDYQRGIDRQNRLHGVLSGTYATPAAREEALIQGGFADEALKFGKDRRDNAKTEADAQVQRMKVVNDKVALYRDGVHQVRDPQTAAQYVSQMYADHDFKGTAITALPLEKLLASIPQDPSQIPAWQQQFALGATKFMEMNKPTITTRNLGGTTDTIATEGLTGKTTRVNSAQNTQSPDNRASVGAQYAIAQSNRDAANINAQGVRDAAAVKDKREAEMKLADDYRTESKGFAETSTAMKKVFGAIDTADKNPGAALAAGTAFMKLLDPNSVVRESELGMALNASGWFDRATNVANTLQNGRIMTSEQQKNLRKAAQDLFEEAKKAQLEVDAAYKNRAKGYGLDAGRIIVDRGQNGSPAKAVKRTGTLNGRKVVEYSDGTVDYAD